MEDFINSRFPKMNLPINQDCESCQYLVKENYELKKLLYETKNELDDLMENNNGWVITMKKKGENNQNFKFIDVKNGFYMIENETGYVIDLGNWVTDNGNVVSACEKNSSTAQQWKLVLL